MSKWHSISPPEGEEIEYRRDGSDQVYTGKVQRTPISEGVYRDAKRLFISEGTPGPTFTVSSWRRRPEIGTMLFSLGR
ncbi:MULTISPECIES: hypothetical protein [unclassified Rhizobium]|uniref:hypothetical protein n=1 Tax=unclassified Rhizobium TaxID=2613769 RepID=UPI0006F59287|nr:MULTISPECIES: hypothetical protein [unclassified Rhizobium]KQV39897.1 hypothetical protein ASC86_21860 [Rhizobium sp. Root1212]KRD31608.1 hypothetical protein ASE37_22905 [Rhizobium sp. Root268]